MRYHIKLCTFAFYQGDISDRIAIQNAEISTADPADLLLQRLKGRAFENCSLLHAESIPNTKVQVQLLSATLGVR